MRQITSVMVSTAVSNSARRGPIPRWSAILLAFLLGCVFTCAVDLYIIPNPPVEQVEEFSFEEHEPSSMSDNLPFKPHKVPSE